MKFLTRKPLREDPVLAGSLLVYDVEPEEIVRVLKIIRARPRLTAGGYLLNDGTVLAVELARMLPGDPIGRVSLATPEDASDATLEVTTDIGRDRPSWEFALNGYPVSESLLALSP